MSGFKLLGIKTGSRIDTKENPTETDYLKVLKENTYYSFYSSYQFNKKTETFTYLPEKDIDLYSSTRDNNESPLHINISAIVGGNGAGKSTLIELLFLGIHNLAATCQILKDPDDGSNWPIETGVHLDIFYLIDSEIYCIKLNDLEVTFSSQSINEDNSFSKFKHFKEATSKDLKFFFYSIAINYSLYGLNSKHTGEWIRALFHKNDAYQTPLVINPMRDKGRIDVNREEDLAKSRLLSNLLIESKSDKHLKVNDKQIVTDLTFKLNRDKIKNIYEKTWMKPNVVLTFEKFYSDFSSETELLDIIYKSLIQVDRSREVRYKTEIEKYIVKKLFKIAHTYNKYNEFLNYKSDNKDTQPSFYYKGEYRLENYIKELKKDESHITFKLNQAVNYIKNNPLFEDQKHKWNIENDHFHIAIKDLAGRINTSKTSQIITLIPPSLFSIEIHLVEIGNEKQKSVFSGLSSGEQQFIHSFQSILYHIINVNSVFNNNSEKDINYKYITLILDEIELYFHPAYQKEFIKSLLNGIKSLNILNIKGINILFSTHSPFILSDIPSSNILRLKVGKPEPEKDQTFGANIHQLLHNDFYLKNGFIGEFAKYKINEVIDYLRNFKWSHEKGEIEKSIGGVKDIEKIEDIKIQLEIIRLQQSRIKSINETLTIKECKEIIELVGEPVLKESLLSLYNEVLTIKKERK